MLDAQDGERTVMPVRLNVGDQVVITPACFERMRSSNRSCVTPNYPSDSYLRKVELFVGEVGEVTHTFLPGYEVTARFCGQSFHMKDSWIEVSHK